MFEINQFTDDDDDELELRPLGALKGHCIEFKYYADGIHSGHTPPG